jgi:transcriptional regulator with XRE-family HTH domain
MSEISHSAPGSAKRAALIRRLCESGWAGQVRLRAGVSCARVAADCGVSPSAVFLWERGRRFPSARHVDMYAVALAEMWAVVQQVEETAGA